MGSTDPERGSFGGGSRPDLAIVLALALAALSPYLPAMQYGYVHFDDFSYILGNPHVLGGLTWEGLVWAFTETAGSLWLPLTWISYQAEISLFGPDPGIQHLTNILLHAANSAGLFLVLRIAGGARLPSAACALLFAWHPTRVESVVWIAERKDVLSTFFAFLALGFYVRGHATRGWRWASFHVCAVLAMMAKPMLVTLPALLLAFDHWPLERRNRGARWTQLLREKMPLAAACAVVAVITVVAQGKGGAVAGLASHPIGLRLVNAVISIGAYLGMLVDPRELAVFYPYIRRFASEPAFLASTLALVAGTALALALRKRMPYLASGWAWFLVALLPILGLVQAGSQALAVRFTYLPFVGLFLVLAWLWWDAHLRGGWIRYLAGAIALLALIALPPLTFRQVRLWRDDETLFEHAARVTRENHLACAQVGLAAMNRGDYRKAAAFLFEAARIQPEHAHYQYLLGIAQLHFGDAPAAILSFLRARQLGGTFRYLDYYLGESLFRSDRPKEAETHFRAFLRLTDPVANPGDATLADFRSRAARHLEAESRGPLTRQEPSPVPPAAAVRPGA